MCRECGGLDQRKEEKRPFHAEKFVASLLPKILNHALVPMASS
jgi:hypothetical protein